MFDANLQDLSENVQRYRTEIPAGLHVRTEVAALLVNNGSEVRLKFHQRLHV